MLVDTENTKTVDFVGRILADKYQIESVLRNDDFGTVYKGIHLLMEKPVTIKILSPALAVDESIVDKFSKEAKTISRISHPNILNITDFGQDAEGTVFIVMEYVEGESVKELVEREGAIDIERAVRITRQAAAALSASHAHGVVHSSLSSRKILVSPVGNGHDIVKLLDIGSFSEGLHSDVQEDSIDEIQYLSPEQCSQESEADERSDIYSLGIVFYELLTGEVPFIADTATDLMLKHAEVPPPPLAAFRSDIPEGIEPILLNILAKNPDRRYQSASALADDLGIAIRGEDEAETIVIPKVIPEAAGKINNAWKTAFIVLAGMSLVAFGMLYFTGTKKAETVTALPTDANSQPVQPLNPATGINEQGNLMTLPPGSLIQGDEALLGPDVGGGDGYDPWGNVPVPPAGGSQSTGPIGPGGETYTIPNDGSVFMPGMDGGGVILVPKYVPETSPSPDPKVSPSPDKSPGKASPSPSPAKSVKPPATPAEKPPVVQPPKKPATEKEKVPAPSSNNRSTGVEQDA